MRKYLLFALLTLFATVSKAQDIRVDVSSNTVGEGEVFKIVYTCNSGQLRSLELGHMPEGVTVEGGPMTSQSSSFSMVNGHMTSNAQTTVAYYLSASKSGVITIPPAKAVLGGKAVSTPAVKITVGGGSSQPQQAPAPKSRQQAQPQQADDDGEKVARNKLFVKAEVSKSRVHEQEAVLLTYKIYTKMNVQRFSPSMPDVNGFHVQELPRPDQIQCHQEGEYNVGILNQYVLYPQQTGTLEIPSLSYSILVGPDPNDPISFFQSQRRLNVEAKGLSISVLPLPEKPAGFSGGVGNFNISAQVDHSRVKASDPITLRVIVDGVGNLKLIQAPEVVLPADFDKYAPKTTDTTRVTKNGLEGSIIYDYIIVPRNEGQYTLQPIEFKYYDIAENAYKTLQTKPISIEVLKGDGNSSITDYSASMGDMDIRGIHTGVVTLRQADSRFFNSTGYFLWLLLPIVLFSILFVVFRKYAIDHANIAKMRGKKANKVATKRLQNAATLMAQNKQTEFYDEVLRALWGYVSDKLNMPAEELSKDNIAGKLSVKGINAETIETFIQAIDDCEYARYAPGDPTGKMDHVYDSAMTAIIDIDNMLNQKKTHTTKAVRMLLMLAFLAFGLDASAAMTKQEADDLYAKGQYKEAIAAYNELLQQGVSADVYYNLGNAYFRTNNITQAVLAYERAYKLAPGNADIRYNLKVAQMKTLDKITPENQMFFVNWYHSLITYTSADNWAKVSIFFMILMLVAMGLYFFVQNMAVIRIGFYTAVVSLTAFALTTLFAILQCNYFRSRVGVVVVAPSVEVKQTPADNAAESMILHEGARADIIDASMNDWLEIRIADGRHGWVKPAEVEKI